MSKTQQLSLAQALRENRMPLHGLLHERDGLSRVERRIGDAHLGNGDRGADEVVAIEVEEGHCEACDEGESLIVPEGRQPAATGAGQVSDRAEPV